MLYLYHLQFKVVSLRNDALIVHNSGHTEHYDVFTKSVLLKM